MGIDIARQLGRFTISRKLIVEEPETVQKIFSECIPVRAENMFSGEVVYMAISEHFEEVPLGQMVPEYDVIAERTVDTVTSEETVEIRFDKRQ